jgi:hypothetical protein
MHPLSPPKIPLASQLLLRRPGPTYVPHPTKGAVLQARDAFHQRVPAPDPGLSPDTDHVGRHWCPDFAAKGPASDMLSRPYPGSARPFSTTAIRRGSQATCRPSASPTECSPSTPSSCLVPSVDRGKPRSRRATRPLAGRAGRAFSGQGSLGFWNRVDPHHDDRSPWWIYPNLTDPGTPAREPVSNPVWKSSRARRSCGTDLFRTDPPACWGKPSQPSRAAFRGPSRKGATNGRTRGAFRPGGLLAGADR